MLDRTPLLTWPPVYKHEVFERERRAEQGGLNRGRSVPALPGLFFLAMAHLPPAFLYLRSGRVSIQ